MIYLTLPIILETVFDILMYQSWALMELTMLTDMSVNCFVATDDSPNLPNYNAKHSVIC